MTTDRECFVQWLNRVDALLGRNNRAQWSLRYWREWFDKGRSEREAASGYIENGNDH